jgi:hypothetical protein
MVCYLVLLLCLCSSIVIVIAVVEFIEVTCLIFGIRGFLYEFIFKGIAWLNRFHRSLYIFEEMALRNFGITDTNLLSNLKKRSFGVRYSRLGRYRPASNQK